MSEVIYQEEIGADVALAIIGDERHVAGAKYHMISMPDHTVILQITPSGEEIEFTLEEPEFKGYDDGISFAKIDPPAEEKKHYYRGLITIVVIMVLCAVAAIGCMIYLSTN